MKRIDCTVVAMRNRVLLLSFAVICLFATAAHAQPYNVFTPADQPAGGTSGAEATNFDNPPGTAIETGVKFRVSQSGVINGIRFYAGDGNTGTHEIHLWDVVGGLPLATASSAAAASGWTEIDFATPFTVIPGQIYIASVYMPTGIYAATSGYFGSPITANGIELLGNGDPTSPGNGVFDYTNSGPLTTPPVSSFGGSNYWIDVSFSPFFPLPAGLFDLKATTSDKDVVVSWKTASESNNRGFEVQRSNNANDWYPLGFVNGYGESSDTKNYSYSDRTLAPGTYYYRLKQLDFDGKSKTSAVVSASIGGKGQVSLFQNYPNPFSATTSIRFDLPKAQYAKLSLLDISGREVRVLTNKMSEAGSHVVTVDGSSLAPQFYIVRLQTEQGVLTRKILVQ